MKRIYEKLCTIGAYIMGSLLLMLTVTIPTAILIASVKLILRMLGVM